MISNVNGARLPATKISGLIGLMRVFPIVMLFAWTPALAGQPSAPRQHVDQRQKVRMYGRLSCPERVTMTIQNIGSWRIQQIKDPQLRQVERAKQSLRLAVLKGDETRVRQLEQPFVEQARKGRGPWAKAKDRSNALQLSLDDAALANQPGMIRLLIGYGAKADFTSESLAVPAITVAARCGNVASMSALYALGADLSAPINSNDEAPKAPRTAIEVAVEERQNGAIVWLLDHGVDICTDHESHRIARFMKHPAAKGKLDPHVVSRLQCGRK